MDASGQTFDVIAIMPRNTPTESNSRIRSLRRTRDHDKRDKVL